MNKSNRVLIIGLDGGTWNVLDPWINDGSLPNLARLRQSGSWGVLRSTIPPLTAPAWSTFMTGKGPGKHGVFHFIPLFGEDNAGTSKPRIVNARSINSSTLWDILGHHGRQVGLINLPMTYPPRPVNGFMITGLLTPRNTTTFTYPAELSRELTDYVIDLDRFIDTKPFMGTADRKAVLPTPSLVEEFRDMLEKRARTSLALMTSKPWDAFMVVFSGTDRLGHHLWPYHRTPEMNDPPEIQELCRAVHEYYVRLDQILGQLLQTAGHDVTTIVMSDHGMGPGSNKRVHLNCWLNQQGFLSLEASGNRFLNPDAWLKGLGVPRDKIGRVILRIPGLFRNRLVAKAVQSRSASVDRERSVAYGVPIPGAGDITGIWINSERGSREALRQQIMARLPKIVDPETNRTVVRWMYRGEDCYRGPYAEGIPDIIVGLDPDYAWGYHLSHYGATVTRVPAVSKRGHHRLEGIFIAAGPNVACRPEPLEGLSIQDIAPTVLYMMGLPIPSDMDGRVLTEILAPAHLESEHIKQGQPMGVWPDEAKAIFRDENISEEDQRQIRARLEALGYLE